MHYALGIDLGGTNIKAVCVTPHGQVLSRQTFRTQDNPAMPWKQHVRDYLGTLKASHGQNPQWVGMAAPGVAWPDGRDIWWMQGKMLGLEGFDWREYLGLETNFWTLNDAHAAMLAEVWQGAAKGIRNVVLLTLGTGVGGAILIDGRLLQGPLGRAGHLGHLSLDIDGPLDLTRTPGSLEYAIGNYSLKDRSKGRFASTRQLVQAHRSGDTHATELWLRSVKSLACAIASIINVLDVEVVIIGGGIALAGQALFDPLAKFMDEVEWRPHNKRVPIVPAELGQWAGALGAAWYVIQQNNRQSPQTLPSEANP